MLKLIDETHYEILRILKEHGKVQASRLPELVTTASQSTVYEKIKELEQAKLIASEWIVEEGKKPKKFYFLTEYGQAAIEKLEELEGILKAAQAGETLTVIREVGEIE